FIAMNKRGQREAKLGDFCIKCHAPMAVREGYTKDGLNMKDAPRSLRGITCYFCHNAQEVTDTHNNPIKLANDTIMRGGIRDPRNPVVHGVAYSTLHDGTRFDSAKLCGSCHDIVTPGGVHLERTYAEWQNSVFSHRGGQTCNNCHMQKMSGVAADDPNVQVPARTVHMHLFPGVDTALTPFPDTKVQRAAIDCELSQAVLVYQLCPSPDPRTEPITLTLETNAGHRFPSGAAHDRRAWVELTAYDAQDKIIYHSGDIAPGSKVEDKQKSSTADHDPLLLRDKIYDKNGNEALMFWDAVPHTPDAASVMCDTLPETKSLTPGSHSCEVRYRLVPPPPTTRRMRVQVHVQAVAREVLDSLVASGDLDPKLADKMPTLTLADSITEWNAGTDLAATDYNCVMNSVPNTLDCPNDYQCLLYPGLPQCSATP
ncbi:MAG TPA: hypothetical protein VF331_12710, partial [Polyangiales bacterium]